jgi:hypothetical protein
MYRFTPAVHRPKNKKEFKRADIWPADILEAAADNRLEYWIMAPDAKFIPFSGYESGYYNKVKQKAQSNV